MFNISSSTSIISRGFHASTVNNHIIKLTRLRVVDNSTIGSTAMAEGKPPKCIHVYNKTGVGRLGDRILVAIKGEKKHAVIVGCKQKQKPFVPKFETNNIVLIDDNGTPLGTRITAPIPYVLRHILKKKSSKRSVDISKIFSLATTFV